MRSPFDRFEAAAIDAELEKIVLAMNADDDRQRLLEIGASRGRLALIEHRGWKHRGHDRRLAVVRRGLVLEAGLPGDELPLGEGVMLVEALRKLLQHPLADFGGIVCPRFVRHAKHREASLHIAHSHDPSALLIALRLPIASRYDRIGRMFAGAASRPQIGTRGAGCVRFRQRLSLRWLWLASNP